MERLPAVLRLADLDRIAVAGTIMRPIRRPLGVSAFGVNAYTGATAGDLVIEPHDELNPGGGRHEELYVVLTGHADVRARRRRARRAGRARSCSPSPSSIARRRARADDTTVLVIGGKPGAAGPPSPFEYYFVAAGERSRRGRTRSAPRGSSTTRTTRRCTTTSRATRRCAGQREDALRHIGIAFEGEPKTREWARDDSDLDSIRTRSELRGQAPLVSRTILPSLPPALNRS